MSILYKCVAPGSAYSLVSFLPWDEGHFGSQARNERVCVED